jgi:hypothetical protein
MVIAKRQSRRVSVPSFDRRTMLVLVRARLVGERGALVSGRIARLVAALLRAS